MWLPAHLHQDTASCRVNADPWVVAGIDADGQAGLGQHIDQVMRATALVLHGPRKVYFPQQHTKPLVILISHTLLRELRAKFLCSR